MPLVGEWSHLPCDCQYELSLLKAKKADDDWPWFGLALSVWCPVPAVSLKRHPAAGQLETVALTQRPLHPRSPLGTQLHVDYWGRSVFRGLSFWSALYSLTVVFHLFLQACHPPYCCDP